MSKKPTPTAPPPAESFPAYLVRLDRELETLEQQLAVAREDVVNLKQQVKDKVAEMRAACRSGRLPLFEDLDH